MTALATIAVCAQHSCLYYRRGYHRYLRKAKHFFWQYSTINEVLTSISTMASIAVIVQYSSQCKSTISKAVYEECDLPLQQQAV
jgi:hypothetical protein